MDALFALVLLGLLGLAIYLPAAHARRKGYSFGMFVILGLVGGILPAMVLSYFAPPRSSLPF